MVIEDVVLAVEDLHHCKVLIFHFFCFQMLLHGLCLWRLLFLGHCSVPHLDCFYDWSFCFLSSAYLWLLVMLVGSGTLSTSFISASLLCWCTLLDPWIQQYLSLLACQNILWICSSSVATKKLRNKHKLSWKLKANCIPMNIYMLIYTFSFIFSARWSCC